MKNTENITVSKDMLVKITQDNKGGEIYAIYGPNIIANITIW